MVANKITGKDLLTCGLPQGRVVGIALSVLTQYYKGKSKRQKLDLISRIVHNPALYKEHEHLDVIASQLMDSQVVNSPMTSEFKSKAQPYAIFGPSGIEPSAIQQMDSAMRLPIVQAGALMPDAHHGYGLPIGGVLATNNAVIPYGVGVDIGCRMCMSIFGVPPVFEYQSMQDFKRMLVDNTRFGQSEFEKKIDHPILDRVEFKEITFVKSFKDRAYRQLGSSGSGNHFVEFGITRIEGNDIFELPKGKYLAVLSHSGSRGLGANIARHYTKIAMSKHKLPAGYKQLSWLDLTWEEGQEYWLAMNLAGDYASACHLQIHQRIAKSLGESPLRMIENHHNFAWKESDVHGNEIIVHRKGATPAGVGILGIIPGSMTAPGFIVKGKGDPSAINSASHGAGRTMSRTQAKKILHRKMVSNFLRNAGVEVIGGDLDEAPMAYKDIHGVMAAQKSLVEVVGSFQPKVVRMAGDRNI